MATRPYLQRAGSRPGDISARDPGRAGQEADGPDRRGRDRARALPTSNLLTKALADEEAVRDTFRALSDHGVRFTIATDGPEMMRTHLPTSSSFCFGSAQLRRSSSGRQTGARMKRASFAAARLS
jgi:hypothetical protein